MSSNKIVSTTTLLNTTPWVEKYRPSDFKDIILEKDNKRLLKNIIKMNRFPNLLFYGPPGTGKTTTIINLIDEYQKKHNQQSKGLKIHLNASDDRGIDIIRNQITQFVNTKSLFNTGLKFVILDEVDYMTKNAQQALRHLIQQNENDVRFCLICNYISRIHFSLKNEFIRLRFCKLPKTKIFQFLNNIIKEENIHVPKGELNSIISKYDTDIRSMINYLQLNMNKDIHIVSGELWEEIILILKNKKDKANNIIKKKCIKYNMTIKTFIIEFVSYTINNKNYGLNNKWLNIGEFISHNNNTNEEYLLHFFIDKYSLLFSNIKNS
tara:strand:- start:3411 stop:4379 length:969 start_codon:yes stop_codon:yes gene_type:complete